MAKGGLAPKMPSDAKIGLARPCTKNRLAKMMQKSLDRYEYTACPDPTKPLLILMTQKNKEDLFMGKLGLAPKMASDAKIGPFDQKSLD